MLSQVGICNSALAKLGEQFIIDISDTSKAARACNECFGRVRDALLRAHRWSFAMTRTSLAALAHTVTVVVPAVGNKYLADGITPNPAYIAPTTALSTVVDPPAYGYSLQFLMPVDLLRLDYVGDLFVGLDLSDFRNGPAAEYQIEGRFILTNLPAPLHIRYVQRVEDTTQFDPLFDELMAARMAVEMANTLTQSDNLKELAAKEFREILRTAIQVNAIEKAPEPLPDDTWMMSRL